jgi:Metal-dependent hydrolases of the beta-lactamase superfamily II
MKLTVLVDNSTYINEYYFGEPALSFYIENENDKILFDLGYSDVFAKNAKLMKIDINSINKIVFSHGHNDHTGGLKYIKKRTDIIAHPDTFKTRKDDEGKYGSFMREEEILKKHNFISTSNMIELSTNLFYLGEIPALNSFETREEMGKIIKDNESPDFTLDDSALVYKGKDAIHIITGCSHSGICNIIEYAKNKFNTDKIGKVIGGFHLFDCNKQVDKTIEYFKQNKIENLYPCHCTSFKVKAKINSEIPIQEVGVGMELEII